MMHSHASASLLPQAGVKVFINVSHVRVCRPERERKRVADNEISLLLPAASW